MFDESSVYKYVIIESSDEGRFVYPENLAGVMSAFGRLQRRDIDEYCKHGAPWVYLINDNGSLSAPLFVIVSGHEEVNTYQVELRHPDGTQYLGVVWVSEDGETTTVGEVTRVRPDGVREYIAASV